MNGSKYWQSNPLYSKLSPDNPNNKLKETLITSPLILFHQHPKLRAAGSYENCILNSEKSLVQPFPNPQTYQHSQLVFPSSALMGKHQFFWAMSYDPQNPKPPKFWGSFKTKKLNSNEKYKDSGVKSYRPKIRPLTKQTNRQCLQNLEGRKRPGTSNSCSRSLFNENNNIQNPEISEFEYNGNKLVRNTEFREKYNCPHGLMNLRKKEVGLWERIKRKQEGSDPYIKEYSRRFPLKRRPKETEIELYRATYEMNFEKTRKFIGKTLAGFP